jgi:predicted ATPase/DNA-binding SARP family transcriptional activator
LLREDIRNESNPYFIESVAVTFDPPTKLSLAFLGSVEVLWVGQPVAVTQNTVRALLAYLAVESDRPHSREILATMLWPDHTQTAAFANLRQTLARLRKLFPNPTDLDTFLTITPQTLQFIPAAATLDVATFTRLLDDCAAHAHHDVRTCPSCHERLVQAAELYQGELLHGLSLKNSQPFDEWLTLSREALHRQAVDLFQMLVESAQAVGDYGQMRLYAERQLALEPWREEAHRQLMWALTLQGDRSGAIAQYETCRRVLEEELGIEPDAETYALYERIRAGELVATAHSPASPHNLPAALTPFVGREAELAELMTRLHEPEMRLLTLVGLGGMGKTRLALELARKQLGAFANGVFFVQLTPLTAPEAIAPTIASTLGVTVVGDTRQALLHTLREKHLLLVLDNFEHLLDGVDIVHAILQAAPQVRILATSRERLQLRGERAVLVQGLDYTLTTEVVPSEAVRLFVQHARRVQPTFELSNKRLHDVERICTLVQGMPLALELAAAWTETLLLDEIATEIEQSIDFLAVEWRDIPERQRSVRAVFDWSWALLNDAERQAFRQLSVFRGGFTREAAQEVLGASLRGISRLVQKSLVRWTTASDSTGRYEIHELLRQFATQRLDAAPNEGAAVAERHSTFYLHFVAARERHLTRNAPHKAVHEIQAEIDNVRQAWIWAARHTLWEKLDQSSYGIWQYCLLTGSLSECESLFRLAIECAYARVEYMPQSEHVSRYHQSVLSRLLGIQANVLSQLCRFETAIQTAQQAIKWSQASRTREGKVLGSFVWGVALFQQGNYQRARTRLEQALQLLYRGNTRDTSTELLHDVEWLSHLYMGAICQSMSEYAQARGFITQALQICQSLGKLRGEVTCLLNLAGIALQEHDYAAAQQGCEQALPVARIIRYRWGEGVTLRILAHTMHGLGQYEQCLDLAERGLAIFREIGIILQQCYAMHVIVRAHTCLGNYEHASTWLDHCSKLIHTVDAPEAEMEQLLLLATLAHHLGKDNLTLQYAEQARRIGQNIGSRLPQSAALILLGHTYVKLHQHMEAGDAYNRALALCDESGEQLLAAEARAGRALIVFARGDVEQAIGDVEAVLNVLVDNSHVGLDEPFYVYLACYHVLHAVGDARATSVLDAARSRLESYAASITDGAWRRSFLTNVTTHRQLIEASGSIDTLPVAPYA